MNGKQIKDCCQIEGWRQRKSKREKKNVTKSFKMLLSWQINGKCHDFCQNHYLFCRLWSFWAQRYRISHLIRFAYTIRLFAEPMCSAHPVEVHPYQINWFVVSCWIYGVRFDLFQVTSIQFQSKLLFNILWSDATRCNRYHTQIFWWKNFQRIKRFVKFL